MAKPEDRTATLRAMYESCGMKLLHLWVLPSMELVSIAEGDPIKNAAHMGVAVAGGAVTDVSFTELLTFEQLAEAMQRAAAIAGKYRQPGK
jgi:uncharacterized protein with GYD domain